MHTSPVKTIKSLQPLVDLIPPPADPSIQLRDLKDWNRVFAFYGTRLPEDYVQFHKLYGFGYFASISHSMTAYLMFFSDAGTNHRTINHNLDDAFGNLNALRQLKEKYPKRVPFDLYFNPGGILPWAKTTNDALLCWKVVGANPDQWPIVVLRSAKGHYEEYDKGMARYLAALLSGEIRSELMPKGFPGDKGVCWEPSRV